MNNYIKLLRVHQWIKNLFLFVPLVFSKHLFDQDYFLITLGAFLLFCITSSIVYVVNDLADIESDRKHPAKRNRPLASGKITKRTAIIIVIILGIILVSFLPFFNILFSYSVIVFLILNFLYTFLFKHIVILDVFSIAAGFMIRIIAGAMVIYVEISNWLILTTMFLSLFLAIMKRHSEIVVLANGEENITRKVLSSYSVDFTRQMATISAAGVIICYALYTVSTRTLTIFKTENLIYTTPFVVFGIFRYMFLVYMKDEGENTTRIMVSDLPMIMTLLLYILTAVIIVYNLI